MRRAHRLDANHAEIVRTFERLGVRCLSLAGLGHGAPDLVCFHPGRRRVWLVEVKDGSKPKSARLLTKMEQDFHDRWAGAVITVESVDSALAFVGALNRDE